MDDRRRVDASDDRLREIPQWPWCRRTVRWVHQQRRSGLWKLRGPDWPRLVVYPGIQDFLAASMGSAGERNADGLSGLNRCAYMSRFYYANFCGVRCDQVITFEKASGWIQWTWKTESVDEWSYSAGLQYGWIPQDPTHRQYPNICD